MITRAANLRMCPTISAADHRIYIKIFAGFSAKLAAISCQSRNRAVIRLDSWGDVADTPGNTPAASLLELVPCHFSDVHQRRVSYRTKTLFLSDIASQPPHLWRPSPVAKCTLGGFFFVPTQTLAKGTTA